MSKRTFTNQEFKHAVETSISIAEILRKINLKPKGSNYSTVKNLAKELNLNISHLLNKVRIGQIKNLKQKIPIDELLVKGRYRSSYTIKRRVLKEQLLENSCRLCGITEWMNELLSLHLDHINGDASDNRLENLRLLCPNCHSQTPTYCGKKNKKLVLCIDCDTKICKHSMRCKTCSDKQKYNTNTKIKWPTVISLLEVLKTTSYVALGKKLGVSDNAIRKRIKKYSI